MKQSKYFLILILALSIALAGPAQGDPPPQGLDLEKSLKVNRELVQNYHKKYLVLKRECDARPTRTLERNLSRLQDQIRALEEDYESLTSFLPKDNQALIFISDLMRKKAIDEKDKTIQNARDFLTETALKQNLSASSSAAEPLYHMHERALQCVSDRNFKDAVKIYEEIILRNPDDDEAYIIMGHTYLLMGQYQKAERAFHNAAHIDPENIREITPFYENAVLQNPNDDIAYANLGYACMILGDMGRAEEAFKEALSINPESVPAQNGLMYLERLAKNGPESV